jgi:hypothetical protein
MLRQGMLVVCALILGVTPVARAADVPIMGLKLIVVDKTVAASKAKAVFVAKDPAVTKGTGTDPTDIQATLDVAYDAVSGTFDMPQGTRWLVNKDTVAKYVNKDAPTDGAVKVSAIKPGNGVKVVGANLGDLPLDISSAPAGPVYVADTIVNGGDTTRLCTQFSGCAHKAIAGGTGHKLVCKGNSSGDPDCTAAAPPAPAFDGPAFPPVGGAVSYSFSGDANAAGGSDLSFFSFTPTTWTALYWGASSGSLPRAGLDGSLHALSFGGISGAGNSIATWQGMSPWTNPGDMIVYDVPIQLTITITAPPSGIAWIDSTGISGLDPGPGTGIGAVVDVAPAGTATDFTVKFEYTADIPTDVDGFIPLSTVPQIGGGLLVTSFSGAFYSKP